MNKYNKITNPKTGRKVKVDGKLGRQIIQSYINNLNGGQTNSYLDPDCSDFGECCPAEYYGNPVVEPTKPLYKVGDYVFTKCNNILNPDGTTTPHNEEGTIINVSEALDEIVHDEECGADRWGEVFTIADCECCIDRRESGSVWFLADNIRKYFIRYSDDYIDLVDEAYIEKRA